MGFKSASIIPVKPSEALKSILQKKEDEILTMEKIANEIIKNENNMTNDEISSETSSFSIIQGRDNIYAKIGKIIQEADDDVYLITTPHDLALMYYTSIPEKIKTCVKNGRQIKVIVG